MPSRREPTAEELYQGQIDLLVEVRRALATVITAKKHLEVQAAAQVARAAKLYADARIAVSAGDEESARQALHGHFEAQAQASDLSSFAGELAARQGRLAESERAFSDRIRQARLEQQTRKAGVDAAAATAAIGDAAAGLGQELGAAGLAVQAARGRRTIFVPGADAAVDSELARLGGALGRAGASSERAPGQERD